MKTSATLWGHCLSGPGCGVHKSTCGCRPDGTPTMPAQGSADARTSPAELTQVCSWLWVWADAATVAIGGPAAGGGGGACGPQQAFFPESPGFRHRVGWGCPHLLQGQISCLRRAPTWPEPRCRVRRLPSAEVQVSPVSKNPQRQPRPAKRWRGAGEGAATHSHHPACVLHPSDTPSQQVPGVEPTSPRSYPPSVTPSHCLPQAPTARGNVCRTF